jgi:hypothetical protein
VFLKGVFQSAVGFKTKSAYEEDENGPVATHDLLAPFNWSTLVLPLKKIKVGLGSN